MRRTASRFLALTTVCALAGLSDAGAGPQTPQTNYTAPCLPPDVNVSTVGIAAGVRSIDELEFTAASTSPVKRRTYEFDRDGRLLAWNLHPLRGGRQEWVKLLWERSRLVAYDAGSFDEANRYQQIQRTRYDYDETGLAKVNRLRSTRRDVTSPIEPTGWQLQDVALVRQQKLPNGDTACLKVPVDEAPAALLEIVGQDGFYRQQVALPIQGTKSEPLAKRELARLVSEGAFKHDYPTENRMGWITILDDQTPVRAFSSVEPAPNADYTRFEGHGQIAETGLLRHHDLPNPQRKFEYRFDRRGNWTEASELVLKDQGGAQEWVPVRSYKRSIRYYD